MILYKYLSRTAGLNVIHSATLGFTQSAGLNDPTETTASFHPGDEKDPFGRFNRRFGIESNYGILAMTRNPINAAMWSHYAQGHTGIVIGINTDLAGLNDEVNCVLPARYGSVIYTSSKPTYPYEQSNAMQVINGHLDYYDRHCMEALQRYFLYKSSEWYYEEEVRVVKSVRRITEAGGYVLDSQAPAGASTYLIEIPKSAITSVHVGLRAAIDFDDLHGLCEEITTALPDVQLFDYHIEKDTWRLKDRALGDWSQTLHEDFFPQS